MATYKVLRQHFGDKLYMPDDLREAREGDVSHLVTAGVLAPVEPKAEAPVRNKALPTIKNKAAE